MSIKTATQITYDALRIIGRIREGSGPSPEDLADGLEFLNDMIDSFQIQRLLVLVVDPVIFSITPGKTTPYTWGIGGDFNAARPEKVENGNFLYQVGTPPYTVVPMGKWDKDDYADVRAPLTQSGIPTNFWFDQDYPTAKVWLYPWPNMPGQVQFYTWLALSQFALTSTSINLPTGYAEMFKYNLAVRLAPLFRSKMVNGQPGIPPLRPEIVALATESLRAVKSQNAPMVKMQSDGAVRPTGSSGAGWLYTTGDYR